jgi:hypothetical protein
LNTRNSTETRRLECGGCGGWFPGASVGVRGAVRRMRRLVLRVWVRVGPGRERWGPGGVRRMRRLVLRLIEYTQLNGDTSVGVRRMRRMVSGRERWGPGGGAADAAVGFAGLGPRGPGA